MFLHVERTDPIPTLPQTVRELPIYADPPDDMRVTARIRELTETDPAATMLDETDKGPPA
jgi:hypothetical protein